MLQSNFEDTLHNGSRDQSYEILQKRSTSAAVVFKICRNNTAVLLARRAWTMRKSVSNDIPRHDRKPFATAVARTVYLLSILPFKDVASCCVMTLCPVEHSRPSSKLIYNNNNLLDFSGFCFSYEVSIANVDEHLRTQRRKMIEHVTLGPQYLELLPGNGSPDYFVKMTVNTADVLNNHNNSSDHSVTSTNWLVSSKVCKNSNNSNHGFWLTQLPFDYYC